MKVQDVLYDGKTKKLSNTDESEKIVIEFLDNLPETVGAKKAVMKGKGALNLEISSYLFEYLESYNVPTHFIRNIDDKTMVVKKLSMIPVSVMVWNVATGMLAKKLGLKDGLLLDSPVLELYYKNAKLKNPLINDYHAYTLGLCERNEMSSLTRIGTKVNAVLKSLFHRKQLTLAYFTLEFGRAGSQIVLGDEISADTLALWQNVEADKLDKKALQITSENTKTMYPQIRDRILK